MLLASILEGISLREHNSARLEDELEGSFIFKTKLGKG